MLPRFVRSTITRSIPGEICGDYVIGFISHASHFLCLVRLSPPTGSTCRGRWARVIDQLFEARWGVSKKIISAFSKNSRRDKALSGGHHASLEIVQTREEDIWFRNCNRRSYIISPDIVSTQTAGSTLDRVRDQVSQELQAHRLLRGHYKRAQWLPPSPRRSRCTRMGYSHLHDSSQHCVTLLYASRCTQPFIVLFDCFRGPSTSMASSLRKY